MTVGGIGAASAQVGIPGANNSNATRSTAIGQPLPLRLPELPTPASLARDIQAFGDDLTRAFREAGIGIPPEPTLTGGYDGSVLVVNGHPDKARIEQLFRDSPDLRDRYAKISADASLLRAAENHRRFSAEYERLQGNPAAQRALVEATIARNEAPFFMAVTARGVDTFFSEALKA